MEQGTSMAAPVVTGLAALLLEYFPYLTPQQVKASIENSTNKPKYKVQAPGDNGTVDLSEISKSGGIINAYNAAIYASKLSPVNKKENNTQQVISPKTTKSQNTVIIKNTRR